MLSVSLIVWALALFDLTLLPRVSSEFLGTLPSKRLVGVAVSPDSVLVTNADPVAHADLWILSRRGAGVQVVGVPLPREHSRRGARKRSLTASVRTTVPDVEGTPIDVDDWPGAGPALFVVSSPRRSPSLRLLSLRSGQPLLDAKLPLPAQKRDRREFFVTRWSGPRPDLFVIDRNASRIGALRLRPWLIRVYSGESGFKALVFRESIPKWLSKRLSEGNWWPDVGVRRLSRSPASRRRSRPSLVLVTRGGRTGTGQTEIHVLSGHSGFRRFTLHTGTAISDRDGSTRRFVFQSGRRGGSVLMAQIEQRRLRLVPVPLP